MKVHYLAWVGLLTVAGLALLAAPASAQYRFRYPQPRRVPVPVPVGGPTIYAPYAGPGGTLAGSADVINAQGQFLKQQEQARIEREKAYQEYLRSKKAAFDLNKYFEANTPTWGEKQEKEKGMLTRRVINDPTTSEMISGKSLNIMLDFLKQLTYQGQAGPLVPIAPSILSKINVTGPTTEGKIAMLSHGGQVDWPLALQDHPMKPVVDKELQQAVQGVLTGTLTNKLYTKLRSDVSRMRDDVKQQYATGKMHAASYLDADDFLERLTFAVYELSRPGAKTALGGGLRPQGRTVGELVYDMTSKGLKFAPATPGDEAAYVALHNAMAQYTLGVQSSYGFQTQSVAPRPAFKLGG